MIARVAYRLLFDVLTPRLRWPVCDGCHQSCTGMYGGKPRCVRCESARTR